MLDKRCSQLGSFCSYYPRRLAVCHQTIRGCVEAKKSPQGVLAELGTKVVES